MGGVNTKLLAPILIKYIVDKEPLVKFYIGKLLDSFNNNKITRANQLFFKEIFKNIDKKYISNLCLLHFLLVYTYQNSENDKFYNLLGVSITMGNKLLNKYYLKLRSNYIKDDISIPFISYTD